MCHAVSAASAFNFKLCLMEKRFEQCWIKIFYVFFEGG